VADLVVVPNVEVQTVVIQNAVTRCAARTAANQIATGEAQNEALNGVIRFVVNQTVPGDFHVARIAVLLVVQGVAPDAVIQSAVNQRAVTRVAMGVPPNEVRQVHPNGALRVAPFVHQSLAVVPDVSRFSVPALAWLLVAQQSAQEYCLPDSACCHPPVHCDVRSDPGAQDAARSRLALLVQDDLLRRLGASPFPKFPKSRRC